MALWDLVGQDRWVAVVDLWGGPSRDDMPLYASGGWADAGGIGDELGGYVAAGVLRREDARRRHRRDRRGERRTGRRRRRALGPDVELMVDAHGTFSVAEAKRFAAGAAPTACAGSRNR